MTSERPLNTLTWRLGIPLTVYTVAMVGDHFVDTLEIPMPVIVAVTTAILSILLVPAALHNFLAHFQRAEVFSKWLLYSYRALLVSLAFLPSYFLIGFHTGFLFYTILAVECSLVAGLHSLFAWSSRHKEDRPPPLQAEQSAPSDRILARSSLQEANKIVEFEHGGFYEQFVLFAGDSKRLVTWMPEKIQVFNTDGTTVGTLTGKRVPVCFSADNESLITTGNGRLERWCLSDMSLTESISDFSKDVESPDGSWTVAAHESGILVLGNTTGFVAPLSGNNWDMFNPYRMAYSAKRDIVLCATGDCVVVFDPVSRSVAWRSPSAGRDVTSVAISPDSKVAVYGSMGGSMFVIDLEQQEVVGRLGLPGEIRCLCFAPDSRHVAVGCGDILNDVIVFNVSSGPRSVVKVDYSNNWSVGFSPDGKMLAVGSDNHMLSLWDWV